MYILSQDWDIFFYFFFYEEKFLCGSSMRWAIVNSFQKLLEKSLFV